MDPSRPGVPLKEFVVDASALIHGLGGEEGSVEAAEFLFDQRDQATLLAPGLLVWEIGNFAHGRTRRRADPDAASRQRLMEDAIQGIQLEAPDVAALRQVAAIAEKYDLTFYDAAYLELASRGPNRGLVTEDVALVRAGAQVLGKRRVLCFGPRPREALANA